MVREPAAGSAAVQPNKNEAAPTRTSARARGMIEEWLLSIQPQNQRGIEPFYKEETMVWPFCPRCRATLRVDYSGAIDCDVCSYHSNLSEMPADQLPSSTTYSMDRPTPMWAKSDAEQAALRHSNEPVRATIEEPCIKCGHREVGYYTVQLRSVDEGSSVFYECPSCKHTWSINN
jgi:DNA-directed RNA polymerase I subunit RPA12